MSGERHAVLTAPPLPADTNFTGQITEGHVAFGHWTIPGTLHHGEFLLCGKSIDYSTYVGTIDDAPECQTCIENDG